MKKKNFPKPCIHSKIQHVLTLYRLASCWGITWSENQCSATLGHLKWGEKSKFKLWFFYGHFRNSFYPFLSHLKNQQLFVWFKNGEWCKDFSHTLCLLSITCLFVMPQDCQAAESALQLHRTPKGREKGREWSFHAVKHSIKLDQNSLIPVWSLWFSLDGHEYSWETKIGTSAWEFWAPWGCTWGNEGALGNAFVMHFLSFIQ